MNGKETKLGRPDFPSKRNLTITFVTLSTVTSTPTTTDVSTLPLLPLSYHLIYDVFDFFVCCRPD